MSTNGFWAALNIATAANLPYLFYIEDNGYGISVPASVQTAGGDHVANRASFRSLHIIDGDGTDPVTTPDLIHQAVQHVRQERGPCLLRLKVPRLCGHTFQDTQTYKPESLIEAEQQNDPAPKLEQYLLDQGWLTEAEMESMREEAASQVSAAVERVRQKPDPDRSQVRKYVYAEQGEPQVMGGLAADQIMMSDSSETPAPEGSRINMLAAIRQTLDPRTRMQSEADGFR